MISPLSPSFAVDVGAVDRVVNYILASGCSGLFVLGLSASRGSRKMSRCVWQPS
jgi:hypothetical protein